MANGARMEGIEADLFFTFFGLDAIRKDRYEKIKVATVGNPGMHLPTWLGAIPGFSALATRMMKRQMEKIDIPPIPEFIELVADSGARLYACKATVDMFGLTMDDFVPQVERDHQRRRVLREGRRRPDHLHVGGSRAFRSRYHDTLSAGWRSKLEVRWSRNCATTAGGTAPTNSATTSPS